MWRNKGTVCIVAVGPRTGPYEGQGKKSWPILSWMRVPSNLACKHTNLARDIHLYANN